MQDARVQEEGHDEGCMLGEPVVRELLRRHSRVSLEQRLPDGIGIHGGGRGERLRG